MDIPKKIKVILNRLCLNFSPCQKKEDSSPRFLCTSSLLQVKNRILALGFFYFKQAGETPISQPISKVSAAIKKLAETLSPPVKRLLFS
jgi:hypothetical protein